MKSLPAIAILLAVCAFVVGCQRPAPDRQATNSQPKIDAIAPKGEVTFPFVFEWKSTGSGPDTIYRVTVYDAAERELFAREMRVPRYQTPADLGPVFSSSRHFLWRVAVMDPTGVVVTQTPLVECRVTGK